MKRYAMIVGVALSSLALTNCTNKEIDTPEQELVKKGGVPFEIIAVPSEETKTIAGDNMSTVWDASNDKLNVFHKLHSATDYTLDGEFSVEDPTAGTFSGTISKNFPESGNNYDWVAIYPYDSKITAFAPSDRYYYVGGYSTKAQLQNGTNSTAHLAGYGYYASEDYDHHRGFPLWGKKENVPYSTSGEEYVSPVISMNQVCSVLAFNITNSTEASINVSKIEFTATEDIVGAYNINFSGETPTFAKYNTYQSETVTLDVTNGSIAAGATGTFYAGIKPFTVEGTDAAPKTLSMTVYTEGGESQTKEFSVKKTMTFVPNKYKNVNMEFTTEHVEPTDPSKYNWVLCKDASDLEVGTEVLIVANTYNFAMSTTQNTNNRGQIGVTKSEDNLRTSSSDAQVFTLVDGTYTTSTSYGFQCVNGENAGDYIYAASSSSNHLKTSGTLNDNASFTISITPAGVATITAKGNNTRNLLKYNATSYCFSCYGSGQQGVSIYTKGSAISSDIKTITSNGTLTFPAVGGSESFASAYTTANIESTETINVTSSENITNATISNGTVTFTMAPNYTGSKVTGSITLTLASDNTATATIPVEQSASSLTVSSETVTIPSDATSATFTVTSKDFGFSIAPSGNVSASPSSSDASDSAIEITVSSNAIAEASETTIGTLTISRTTDDPQEKTVTIKKAAKAEEGSAWVRTAITELIDGDLIAIVDVTSSRAMSNNNGTGSAPSATSITLISDKSRLTAEPAATLQWVFGGDATNGYTFNVSGTNNYLYCTNTNNGVRVGENANNKFTISNNFLKNNETSRYIGVYNNQDWRCYTSINTNIQNTSIAFYKKTGGSSGGTVWNLSGISITTPPSKTSYNAGENFDPTEMVVTANYVDSGDATKTNTKTLSISDLVFSPATTDALTVSNTSVTVSYTEGGVTKTASQAITVNKANPNLVVTPSPVNVVVGKTVQLSVAGTDGALSYTSNGTGYATVNSSGLVTGVAVGSTTITITSGASANYNAGSTTVTVNVIQGSEGLDLSELEDFSSWGQSYSNHTITYNGANITFNNFSRQTGSMPITDIPVTKSGNLTIVLSSGTMSSISIKLRQWSSKQKTVTLQYSTDRGNSYSAFSPAVSASVSTSTVGAEFTISQASLPTGTNAIKLVQGDTGNQVGVASISFN